MRGEWGQRTLNPARKVRAEGQHRVKLSAAARRERRRQSVFFLCALVQDAQPSGG